MKEAKAKAAKEGEEGRLSAGNISLQWRHYQQRRSIRNYAAEAKHHHRKKKNAWRMAASISLRSALQRSI